MPENEATTIAGLVIHETQSIPEEKQAFTFHGKRFIVLKRDKNRLAENQDQARGGDRSALACAFDRTLTMPVQVSKSQFKAHALEYFRKVETTGEPLIVTDHGKPTLEIRKVAAKEAQKARFTTVFSRQVPQAR